MPRRDRTDVEKVSKNDAVWAIVGWMGAYEGRSGIPLEELLSESRTDDELTGEEGIPAEIVAGYRLALREARRHDDALLRARGRRG